MYDLNAIIQNTNISIFKANLSFNKIDDSFKIIENSELYLINKVDFDLVVNYCRKSFHSKNMYKSNWRNLDFDYDLSSLFIWIGTNLIASIIPSNTKNLQKLAQIFLNSKPRNGGSYEAAPYQEAAVDPEFCKYIKAKVTHLNELFAKVNSLEYCRQIYNIYAMVDEFLNHYPEGVISEEEVAIGTLVYKEVEKMQGGTGGRLFEFEKDFNERTWEYRSKIMKICIPPSHVELRELIDMVKYGE